MQVFSKFFVGPVFDHKLKPETYFNVFNKRACVYMYAYLGRACPNGLGEFSMRGMWINEPNEKCLLIRKWHTQAAFVLFCFVGIGTRFDGVTAGLWNRSILLNNILLPTCPDTTAMA